MHDTALTTHHDTMVCFYLLFGLLLLFMSCHTGSRLGSGHMTGMYCMLFSFAVEDESHIEGNLGLGSEGGAKSWEDKSGDEGPRRVKSGEGEKER